MEIKKFNPDGMEAPLAGGVVERTAVNDQMEDDVTMEDEDVNSEGELTEGEDDDMESAEGEDAKDQDDEADESDVEDESADDSEDVDENAFDSK